MKLPLRWLKDYVNITMAPEALAHRLTLAGLEVGSMERTGGDWQNVYVGHVVAVEPHPNADRLRLATVDLGSERQTVVCGAPNVAPGQKIAFAKVGTKLIDGHTGKPTVLKPARIRGVESAGMVCSEKELGLSEEHEGILVLPDDAPVGVPLSDYLGDVIFDLELTPNRPDALSVLGIAREVAALTGQSVKEPVAAYAEAGPPIGQQTSVEVLDPDLCPRYCATLITGLRVGPSPRWMQERLQAAGMRPINNIVDITNYVTMEYGQPLHAFDFDTLAEKRIVVRRARPGETIVTLDGQERQLSPDMLAICDAQRPVALAGIMGGAGTGVTEGTTAILLESANFNLVSIRRTSHALALRTEASLRFEKGLSPKLPPIAARRATQLILELAGGQTAQGLVDVYPVRRESKAIVLPQARARRVLGMDLSLEQMTSALAALGCQCELRHDSLLVTPPYWRTDLRLPDDLVEEVARVTGYDQLPATMLRGEVPLRQPNPARELRERLRDLLVACGLQEVITYSLVGESLLVKAGLTPGLRVVNPVSQEQQYLRTSLRPSLLSCLAANQRRTEAGLRLFEVGRAYLPRENDLPEEHEVLAAAWAGPRSAPSWSTPQDNLDFYDAKGVVEELSSRLGLALHFEAATDPHLHPGRCASLVAGGSAVGVLGELQRSVADAFDISLSPVVLLEIDLASIIPLVAEPRYRSLPRFPEAIRDIAVVVDAGLPSEKLRQAILSNPLIVACQVFDVYRGAPVPPGKVSLAFRIVYRSPERTLTEAEVDAAHQRIVQRLEHEFSATLRQ